MNLVVAPRSKERIFVTTLFFLTIFLMNTCTTVETIVKSKETDANEKPKDVSSVNMVPILTPDSIFSIDRYEVTSMDDVFYFSAPNQDPLTQVTLEEAKDICKSMNKSLCSEDQWLRACLGSKRVAYGYSSSFDEARCNVFGSAIKLTGSFKNCTSDGQIFDMVGNVMEWVDSDISSDAGVVAGGSYLSGKETNCFSRQIISKNSRSSQVGFRCCKNG